MGSFSRAAEDLGLSKATVSKGHHAAGGDAATPLFHRTSRTAVLDRERARRRSSGRSASWRRARRSRPMWARGRWRPRPRAHGGAHVVRHRASGAGLAGLLRALSGYPDRAQFQRQADRSGERQLRSRVAHRDAGRFIADRAALCEVRILLVGSPGYFRQHGHPQHPQDLGAHQALFYTLGRRAMPGSSCIMRAGRYTVSGPARCASTMPMR